MNIVALALCLSVTAAQPAAKPKAKPAFEPTSNYQIKAIEGWKVYVHQDLLTTKKVVGAEALNVLAAHLHMVARVVPKAALAKLRAVPIWLEDNPKVACACYHPSKGWLQKNGFNPEKAKCVEIGGPKNFINWTRHQFCMVLHELAHAYHDRDLGGYGNAELKAAYERMKKTGRYEKVMLFSGKTVKHYALNNPMEYFAESTEAYFGTNDFYPFVRAELKEFDPEMHALVKKLWEKK